MRHCLYYWIVALLLVSCHKKQPESEPQIETITESIAQELTVVTEAMGDLDHDGIPERAIIFNTNETTDYGNVRELQIQKKEKDEWIKWYSSTTAVLKSDDGGMMGDPLDLMEIKDGILKISFYGGSSWKWSYTDSYQFQNNRFELTHYSSSNFKICESVTAIEYDLTTGTLEYHQEYQKCENDIPEIIKTESESFIKKIPVISLEQRHHKEITLTAPKLGAVIYISSGNI